MPNQNSYKPASAKLKRRKPVQCSAIVRRLADDWESEAVAYVKITGDKYNEVSHAIRWCKNELLKASTQPSNAEVSESAREKSKP